MVVVAANNIPPKTTDAKHQIPEVNPALTSRGTFFEIRLKDKKPRWIPMEINVSLAR